MGVEHFEVLVRDQASGQELKREWTKPELMQGIAWLKYMNARGSEVFVRPAGQHGLVLIDALNADNLEAKNSWRTSKVGFVRRRSSGIESDLGRSKRGKIWAEVVEQCSPLSAGDYFIDKEKFWPDRTQSARPSSRPAQCRVLL